MKASALVHTGGKDGSAALGSCDKAMFPGVGGPYKYKTNGTTSMQKTPPQGTTPQTPGKQSSVSRMYKYSEALVCRSAV